MYQKLLIANRGEIAVRIIRACREMGIATVAVCSTADREALHAQLADECVCIGPARPAESYLNMEQILSAAISTGAQAIHPGFGFLSENTKFARMCRQCGIDFIGPSPESIEKMGDKSQARQTMISAGVPVVPGTQETLTDAEQAQKEAEKIGYPVIIKASAGGGGKGMRVAQNAGEFKELFLMAQNETKQAFGDDRMYLEKYLGNARHIEVQVLADRFGNTIHLGERDCSIQRRHQKMIEESPAVSLGEKLRGEMGDAAVRAAKAAGYYSAGTVEFLVDGDGRFYFMEMNTRIQVEHPVTEMVTGIDLIKQMIRIAAGEKLAYAQEDVTVRGHAIECRISAEDPGRGFLPCAGTVTGLYLPGGNGVRVDSLLFNGCSIPPFYDSMLAKIIVHADTRKEAICKMRSALGELIIEGITTNADFLYDLVGSEWFAEGDSKAINAALEERCRVC
ncbi:MAG TPA: acetyl-CoA carboxylase biotin carboxylase subunit [Candidatus Choladousia intestinipullorum]|nr:acetyl-CoA carboxylase biotin carboxylase subunit [Candidatus Choladousia intestinipullorum]